MRIFQYKFYRNFLRLHLKPPFPRGVTPPASPPAEHPSAVVVRTLDVLCCVVYIRTLMGIGARANDWPWAHEKLNLAPHTSWYCHHLNAFVSCVLIALNIISFCMVGLLKLRRLR